MRMLLTRSLGGLVLLAASASCGGSAPAASVAPNAPTPLPASIVMSANCPKPVHPGETAPAACIIGVSGGVSRPVAGAADLRQFGGPAEARLVPCPACGNIELDLDVRVPADMPPGTVTVPVWVTDANGLRADTTAVIRVTLP